MPLEVRYLLARCVVVQADDAGVACAGEEFASRAEGDGSDGLDQTGERVEQAGGVVAEDIDVAAFVAGGGEAAVEGLFDISITPVRTMGGVAGDSIPSRHTSQNCPS